MNKEEQEWIYKERAVLVGVDVPDDPGEINGDFDRSMEELHNLAKACLIEPVALVTQKMAAVNKGLYIGTGKVQEVREIAKRLDADLVIFDNSMTPSQLSNL